MKPETHFFNTDLNGLKTDILNGRIKWVALDGNRTNKTLILTDFYNLIILMSETAIINQDKWALN